MIFLRPDWMLQRHSVSFYRYLLLNNQADEMDIIIDHFDNWAADPGHVEGENHLRITVETLTADN